MRRIIFLLLISLSFSQHLRVESGKGGSSANSWIGFLIGPLLFILAFPIIWYNERKASINFKHLTQAQKLCRSYGDVMLIPTGQLIHISGQTITKQILTDHITGVSVNNALKLIISVQVKQWRRMGGGSQAPVGLQWVDHNMSEVGDKYNDPRNWIVKSEVITSNSVNLGRFVLSYQQIQQCQKTISILPSQQNIIKIIQTNPELANKNPTISGEYIYFNANPQRQGSMRIKVAYCPTGPLSVICSISADDYHLQPYKIADLDNNQALCTLSEIARQWFQPIHTIDLVKQQIVSQHQMIEQAMESNKTYTFIMRVLAFLLLIIGCVLFLSPISKALGYIPFVGGFLKGTSFFLFLLAAIFLSIPVYLITFSIAWIIYHPKVGIIIFAIGSVILIGLFLYNHYSSKQPIPQQFIQQQYMIIHRPYQ